MITYQKHCNDIKDKEENLESIEKGYKDMKN